MMLLLIVAVLVTVIGGVVLVVVLVTRNGRSTPAALPAGFYPDPGNPGQERFFDGRAWTAQARLGGAAPGSAGGPPVGPLHG